MPLKLASDKFIAKRLITKPSLKLYIGDLLLILTCPLGTKELGAECQTVWKLRKYTAKTVFFETCSLDNTKCLKMTILYSLQN